MKIKNKYIIGTHVVFYEIEILREFLESIKQALESVENKENVRVELLFNLSQLFERIDESRITKEELIDRFMKEIEYIEMMRSFIISGIIEET
jgi:dsDNA-specific endonuclease/ATPase MutS2